MRTSRLAFFAVLTLSVTAAADAAVVINPVPQPIRPGLGASVIPFTTAPATALAGTRANVQGMRTPADGSGRLFVNDTRGVISVTDRSGGTAAP